MVAAPATGSASRRRWLIAYALFYLALTDALFRFGGTGSRAVMSLANVVLGRTRDIDRTSVTSENC